MPHLLSSNIGASGTTSLVSVGDLIGGCDFLQTATRSGHRRRARTRFRQVLSIQPSLNTIYHIPMYIPETSPVLRTLRSQGL